MIFFLFFPENRTQQYGDSLHKMSNHIFWEKIRKKKKSLKILFIDIFTQHAKN